MSTGIVIKNNDNNILISNTAESFHYLGSTSTAIVNAIPAILDTNIRVVAGHENNEGGVFVYKFYDTVVTSSPILVFIAPALNNVAYSWIDHYMDGTTLVVHITFDRAAATPPRILLFSTLSNSTQYANIENEYGIIVKNSNGVVTFDSRFTPLNIVDTKVAKLSDVASVYATEGLTGSCGTTVSIQQNVTAFCYRAVAYGSSYVYETSQTETRCNSCKRLEVWCVDKYRKKVTRSEWWSYLTAGIKLSKGISITPKWVQHTKLSAYAKNSGSCVPRVTGLWSALLSGVSSMLHGTFINTLSIAFSSILPSILTSRAPRGTYHKATNTTQDTACNTVLLIDSGIYSDNLVIAPLEPIILYNNIIDENSSLVIYLIDMGIINVDTIVKISTDNEGSATIVDNTIEFTPQDDFIGTTTISITILENSTGTGVYPKATVIDAVITTIEHITDNYIFDDITPIVGIVSNYYTNIPITLTNTLPITSTEMLNITTDDGLVCYIESSINLDVNTLLIMLNIGGNVDGNITISALDSNSDIQCKYFDEPQVTVLSDSMTISSTFGDSTIVTNTTDYEILEAPTVLRKTDNSYSITLIDNDTQYRFSEASEKFTNVEEGYNALDYFYDSIPINNGTSYTINNTTLLKLAGYPNDEITNVIVSNAQVNFTTDTTIIILDSLANGELLVALEIPNVSNSYINLYFNIVFIIANIENGSTSLTIPRTDNTDLHDSYVGCKIKWHDLFPISLVSTDVQGAIKVKNSQSDTYITTATNDDIITTTYDNITTECSGEYLSIWASDESTIPSYPETVDIAFTVEYLDIEYIVTIAIGATPWIGDKVPFSGAASLNSNSDITYSTTTYIRVDNYAQSIFDTIKRSAIFTRNRVIVGYIVEDNIVGTDSMFRPLRYSCLNNSSIVMMPPSILDYNPSTYLEALLVPPIPLTADTPYTTELVFSDFDCYALTKNDTLDTIIVAEYDGAQPNYKSIIKQVPYLEPSVTELHLNTDTIYMDSISGYIGQTYNSVIETLSEGTEIIYKKISTASFDYYVNKGDTRIYSIVLERFSDESVFDCSMYGSNAPCAYSSTDSVQNFTCVLVATYINSLGAKGVIEKEISFIIKDPDLTSGSITSNGYFNVGSPTLSKSYVLTSDLQDIGITYSIGDKWVIPSKRLSGQISFYPKSLSSSLWANDEFNDILLLTKYAPYTTRRFRIYKDPMLALSVTAPIIYSGDSDSTNWLLKISKTELLDGFSIVDGDVVDDNTFTIVVAVGGDDNSPTYSVDINVDYDYASLHYTLPDNSDPIEGGSHTIEYTCIWQIDGETYTKNYYEFILYTHKYSVIDFTGLSQFNSTFRNSGNGELATVTPEEYTKQLPISMEAKGVFGTEGDNGELIINAQTDVFGNASLAIGGEDTLYFSIS